MGDLDIDVDDLSKALEIARGIDPYGYTDIQKAVIEDATKKFRRTQMRAEAAAIKPTRAPGVSDLGGFKIFKANNGFIIQVGRGEGYIFEDAYVCKEANEIGDLITAHIVGKVLED